MNTDSFRNSEIAVVALTRKGVELGRRLETMFPGSRLYRPEKFGPGQENEHPFSSPVSEVVNKVFPQYRYLVLIMAVGIAVRLVASQLKDKHQDPGVVVIDDAATFAVSLLSGHIGGANELARRIASLLGAQPVITTASDVTGTISVDLLGQEFGWELEDNSNVTAVSAALVNGETVGVYQDAGETNWWSEPEPLPDNVHIFTSIEELNRSACQAALIITDRILSQPSQALLPGHSVIYRPRSLVIGIGCNRGTKSSEIEAAVNSVLAEYGLSRKSVRNLASIDLKQNEVGLVEFARTYELPVAYFDKESLSQTDFPSAPSAAALSSVGTPAVCESAAILSSGNASLIVPKVRYNRTVTIAVARIVATEGSKPMGKLFVVGIGPGDAEQMTFKAREAIARSEVVIGYQTYIQLIEAFLSQKEVIASGMTTEVDRVRKALSLAKAGKIVALISSGDAGIYGMAGLVGEMLGQPTGDTPDIEIIPGVPALAATAALLGAPLSGDFAAISLSDYLVSWAEISRRLALASQADFVIVLYNPKSRQRQQELTKAREIIRQYRSPSTPVGIVTNAYRQNQQVTVTDLAHLLDYEVGMTTTDIIGNSTTSVSNNWMVTPRGYQTKYNLKDEA